MQVWRHPGPERRAAHDRPLENTPVLTTERLTLRAPQASDFEVFAPFVMSDRARYIGGGADKDIGHAWRSWQSSRAIGTCAASAPSWPRIG
jgi:hypothetical protein